MGTNLIMILQVLQILDLILPQCLSDVRILDDIQHGLRLLLQPLLCDNGIFAFGIKIWNPE